MVDTATGQTIAFVVFTGTVQEVFAVQLLPHRFPALLEMSDPLLRNSYAVPDEALADVAPDDPIEQQFERALENHRAKRFDEAVTGYRALLVHRPDDITTWFHLGLALTEAERWADGEAALRKVVAQQPGHAQACNTLGLCCAGQGHWADALAAYEKALSADSQYAEAHVNRALLLLKLGRYEDAWKDWDWRRHRRDASRLACPQPMWDGTPIADKVLLVHVEQTAAEVIQFARFLPLAASFCRKLILACDEDLRPLLANVPGVAEARVPDAVLLDSFDLHSPIMSLPGLLGIGLARLPGEVPYVAVPSYISVPSFHTDARRKVGICWSTAGSAGGSDLGGLPYPPLSALFDVEDHAFFALQTPVSREAAVWLSERGAINLEPELTDAARLAALIEQMDLVIGPDHTVTHLAGALGKPVWVLLGTQEGWTWLLERTDSPWYPTARLFRQSRDGGWAALIARVKQALLDGCQ
ncbi:MAG: tetratricopeptide repeat protein [Gammaproteobacteria bacterium]|nr:tetratricopeptide repeat protein [Gammaproteobacteria bacterium]